MSRKNIKKIEQKVINKIVPSKNHEIFWLLGMLAIIFIVYFPSLFNGFTNWDDPSYITKNEFIKGLGLQNLKIMFGEFHNGHYHPLTWVSLALNYSISALNPVGYHITNLLIHLLNAFLVYIVIKK